MVSTKRLGIAKLTNQHKQISVSETSKVKVNFSPETWPEVQIQKCSTGNGSEQSLQKQVLDNSCIVSRWVKIKILLDIMSITKH